MSPSATPATQKRRGVTGASGDQGRHQSQPSAVSATPATQKEGRCHQAPRLPQKTKADVTKATPATQKRRGVTGGQRRPRPPPEPCGFLLQGEHKRLNALELSCQLVTALTPRGKYQALKIYYSGWHRGKSTRCWHLAAMADDKGQHAERLEKHRRKFVVEEAGGRRVPADRSPDKPWTACFTALALDDGSWNEQVRYPAAAWMASGGRGVALAPAEQVAQSHVAGGLYALDVEKEDVGDGRNKRQSNRDRRHAKAKRIRADREELDKLRKQSFGGGGPSGSAGKSKGKGKSNDQAGVQICNFFANGSGPCGSLEPGAPCVQAQKCAHKCQYCFSPGHRNADCPKKS
eukprot:s2029_g16.t1